jgi:predicted HicB family RNase H-like nuclease
MDSLQTTQVTETSRFNQMSQAPQVPSRLPKAAPSPGEKLAADLKVFNQVASEVRTRLNPNLPENLRRRQVVEVAAELFGVAPTWIAFFREIMGVEGVARTLFATNDSYREYEKSPEHLQVLEMLTTLRSRDLPENDPSEAQRMITVRIPKCMHDWICDEANRLEVSVNKLCISRLVQLLDERMIPTSQQKRRGRKPGCAGQPTSSTSSETADCDPATDVSVSTL